MPSLIGLIQSLSHFFHVVQGDCTVPFFVAAVEFVGLLAVAS
jgi:hypothetical protein